MAENVIMRALLFVTINCSALTKLWKIKSLLLTYIFVLTNCTCYTVEYQVLVGLLSACKSAALDYKNTLVRL